MYVHISVLYIDLFKSFLCKYIYIRLHMYVEILFKYFTLMCIRDKQINLHLYKHMSKKSIRMTHKFATPDFYLIHDNKSLYSVKHS